MAQKKIISVNLASVQDIDKLASELDKVGKSALASAQKAVDIAKTMNPHLAEARKGYMNTSDFTIKGYGLYKELQTAFKNLGVDMPKDILDRFDEIARNAGTYGSKITSTMLEAKNIIDNRY
jgi:hypothetical protein